MEMSKKSLYKQIRNKEREKESEEKCFLCDSTFSNKGNLNKHLQKSHGVDNRSSVRVLKCPLCEQDCTTFLNLCEHISIVHNVEMKKECKDFDLLQEFKIWKRNVEKEDLSFFVVQRVVGNKTYYACHRSGSSQKEGTGKRMKWSKTYKTGKICPAGMILTHNEGQVTVEFRRTHVGHALNMKFLHLSKEERDELAGRIKSGMTFERILDDIRKSASTAEIVDRFHAVDKRDLHNIIRDYDLDKDIVHTNDAFSTEIWVQEQMLLKENSPIIYFKMQGCEKEGPLLKEDFMIVIMTLYQKDVLVKYATDRICIDITHGTTSHDFQLTTLLTVDEFGAGCPVAFCISNRIDSVAMSRFFLLTLIMFIMTPLQNRYNY